MSTGRSGIFSGLNIWAGNDDLRNCDSHFVFPPRSTFPQQPRQYFNSLLWNVLTFNVLMMCNVMWNKLKQLKLKKYEIYIKIFFKCPGGVLIWFVGFTKQWPCFLCTITHWHCFFVFYNTLKLCLCFITHWHFFDTALTTSHPPITQWSLTPPLPPGASGEMQNISDQISARVSCNDA